MDSLKAFHARESKLLSYTCVKIENLFNSFQVKSIGASLLLISMLGMGTSHLLRAQSPTAPAKTDGLVNIPGTHIFITLPAGFKLATGFKGVEENKNTLIKVYDPYKTNYVKYAQGFTRESLDNGGNEVQEYKKLSISGYSAKYAALQNMLGGTSYLLVLGDSNFSAMLVGVCPANSDTDGRKIKAALLSLKYDKNMKIDPLSGTFFNINDTNSGYRFNKCNDDFYVYSTDSILKDPYSGESILSILPFTSEYSVGDATIATAIRSSYEQYGITDAKIKKETQVQIGKLNAMEAEVEAKIDNKKAIIYRLTLINGQKAVLVMGIATSDFDKNMDTFRSLASTLRFK